MADAGHNSELSPSELKALKFHHFNAISAQRARVAVEQAEYKRLRKLAKADSIPLWQIDYMFKCSDVEDPDIIPNRIKDEAEIASWFALPIHFQPDMFGLEREPGEDMAARLGEAAGYAGKDCDPPYDTTSPMGKAWSGGWRKGQDAQLADWQSAMEKKNAAMPEQGEPDFPDGE